jgi:DNA-binding MarR family transcriptional regulator
VSDIDTEPSPQDGPLADGPLVDEWRRLLARHAAVSGALEHELQQRHGIGVNEFEALERLADSNDDRCRAQELTEALPLSQSAASRLVARLERQGLVTRAICDMDRRGVFVCLTEAGLARYRAARPTQRTVLAANLRAD